ncbi:MAG: hypothetical protein LBK73_08690 [Treponema sp.]|nr:hypothetical protein [Treponema sp.]
MLENGGVSYYSSTDDAALAWAMRYYGESYRAGVEYGAFIYQSEVPVNGSNVAGYYLGAAIKGEATSISNFWQTEDEINKLVAGWIHTHGNKGGKGDLVFSLRNKQGEAGDAYVTTWTSHDRKAYLDAHGLTDNSLAPGYLVNNNGTLLKASLEWKDRSMLDEIQGLLFTDTRYVTTVAQGIPR